jgi:hypothetical protein
MENFSHNYFSSTGGMPPVDYFNGNMIKPLSLASRSFITPGGVSAPDGGTTVATLGLSLGVIALGLRRRKSSTRS